MNYQQLAAMGRGTDNTIAHLTKGEMTVPVEIQRENPELMQAIRVAILKAGGNPDLHVVGNGAINPETGLEEHGLKKFFKKALSFIAPIAGAVIGSAIPVVGPAIGAAVGSGLATKAQGGSWGQALMSAGGSYLGSQLLGPALNGAGVGTGSVAQSLNETVWSALPSEVSSSLTAQSIQNAIGDTAWSSVIGSQVGGYAADHASGFATQADKAEKDLGMVGAAAAPALPSMPGSAALPVPVAGLGNGQQGAGGAAGGGAAAAPGVSFVQATKDRNTGSLGYSYVSPFGFENNDYGRRGGWGASITI